MATSAVDLVFLHQQKRSRDKSLFLVRLYTGCPVLGPGPEMLKAYPGHRAPASPMAFPQLSTPCLWGARAPGMHIWPEETFGNACGKSIA